MKIINVKETPVHIKCSDFNEGINIIPFTYTCPATPGLAFHEQPTQEHGVVIIIPSNGGYMIIARCVDGAYVKFEVIGYYTSFGYVKQEADMTYESTSGPQLQARRGTDIEQDGHAQFLEQIPEMAREEVDHVLKNYKLGYYSIKED